MLMHGWTSDDLGARVERALVDVERVGAAQPARRDGRARRLALVPPAQGAAHIGRQLSCLLYTSPSPRDATLSRMPSSA